MGFTESVPAGNQGHRFFIVHSHPGKSLPDIFRSSDGIRVAVRPFRIHIDQAHLHGCQRIFQVAFAGIAFISQPFGFGPPVNVLQRLPYILTSPGKAKGFKAHGFKGYIAGQYHQVSPGYFAAILLLDRPEQPARLVEVHIVGPAVERCKAL